MKKIYIYNQPTNQPNKMMKASTKQYPFTYNTNQKQNTQNTVKNSKRGETIPITRNKKNVHKICEQSKTWITKFQHR